MLRTIKDIAEHLAVLQFLEKPTDTSGNCLSAFFRELLGYAHPETATIADALFGIGITAFLIIKLTENQIQQLPKSRFLHAFIAIDIVMTALECLNQRFVCRLTGHGTIALRFQVGKRLTISREIGNILYVRLSKVIFRIIAVQQILPVGPASKFTICKRQDIVEHGFCAFLRIRRFHLCIFGNNDKANEVLHLMCLTFIEDSQINTLSPTLFRIRLLVSHPKVTFHVFRSKSIFFSHHIYH